MFAFAEQPDAGSTDAAFPVMERAVPVIANTWVNAEYKHLTVACGEPAASAQPGQFFQLSCPPSGALVPFLRRPMSFYRADPIAERLEFLYKVTGAGTQGLATLEAGDVLPLLGPLGRGFVLDPAWRHVVVVGRGVGLATLAPLSAAARERGIRVSAILSARSPEFLMSVELLAREGARVVCVTDAEGTSDPVNVERLLREWLPDGIDALFTCGSNRLMLLLQRFGREHGIPGAVALEQQMACGLGMCYCCVREFRVDDAIVHRRVCCEGPVFDLDEALRW